VIQRNIVETPGWYTAYPPYQPEIAQGRLEALLNKHTVTADLTIPPIANASLLDEATAAAEAVHLTQSVTTVPAGATPVYLVAENCHPQTIAVLQTRAGARGLKVQVADPARFRFTPGVIGALVQYPTTDGAIAEYAGVCAAPRAADGAADARAAHPAREGHEQRVHRAGAPRRDGEHVRRVSRPRGPAPHRATGAHPHRAARGRAQPAGLPHRPSVVLRHPVRRGRVVGAVAAD